MNSGLLKGIPAMNVENKTIINISVAAVSCDNRTTIKIINFFLFVFVSFET